MTIKIFRRKNSNVLKKQIFERANVSPKLVNNFLRNLLRAKFSFCVEKSIKRIVELSGHF